MPIETLPSLHCQFRAEMDRSKPFLFSSVVTKTLSPTFYLCGIAQGMLTEQVSLFPANNPITYAVCTEIRCSALD